MIRRITTEMVTPSLRAISSRAANWAGDSRIERLGLWPVTGRPGPRFLVTSFTNYGLQYLRLICNFRRPRTVLVTPHAA
jgi:hypothetical protein